VAVKYPAQGRFPGLLPGKAGAIFALFLGWSFLFFPGLCAQSGTGSSSGHYSTVPQSLDAGGGTFSSARYRVDASLNSHGGVIASPRSQAVARQGYVGMLNEPPHARYDVTGKIAGEPIYISVEELLANDSDLENDPLSLSIPEQRTALGGSVILTDGLILYTPAMDNVRGHEDSFTYTARDDHGGFAVGRVFLIPMDPARNIRVTERIGDELKLIFLGVPKAIYKIQWLEQWGPDVPWVDYPANPALQPAENDGSYAFIVPMNLAQGFFRTVRIQDPTPVLELVVQEEKLAMRFLGIPSIRYKLQFRAGLGPGPSWEDYPDSNFPMFQEADEEGLYGFEVPISGEEGYFRTAPYYP
jgi:hypothetical protein